MGRTAPPQPHVDPGTLPGPLEAREAVRLPGPVGEHQEYDDARVRATVAAAPADWWAGIGFAGRRHLLDRWRADLAAHLDELAELVHAETGKPRGDAVLEIGLALEHLAWATRHARRVLGRRRVRSTLVAAHLGASVEYLPFGVVGVIGPWNYPVFTPMGSIGYALASGNAVVFKPSELTPATGVFLAESFQRAVGEPVLQVVTGGAQTGAALCRAGVGTLAFTGSTATGAKVMASCAETLTPVLIEAGGKDVLIIDEDADVEEAARAAVWGGMSNAGQTCIGVEQVLVHERVYDQAVAAIVRAAEHVRAGSDDGADLGPLTLPAQVGVIGSQVAEALARGARAVVGDAEAVAAGEGATDAGAADAGAADAGAAPDTDRPDGGRLVQPLVLVDTPTGARIQSEETFGPVLTIDPVRDMDEAVERANAVGYGLGGTVFSRRRGPEIARRLRSGMTAVNNVIGFAALPTLPFGGVGDSGFGRIHGPDGLRAFCYAKSVAHQRFRPPVSLTQFEGRGTAMERFATIIALRHGRPLQHGRPLPGSRRPGK